MRLRYASFFLLIFSISNSIFAADDLALTNARIDVYDLEYEKMPLSQAQDMTFIVNYSNIASFNHTGVYVNLKIVNSLNDTIYDHNSSVKTVASGSLDSSYINTPFNAPEAGNYTLIFTMHQDLVDADTTNNIIINTLKVDPNSMQRDDGIYTGYNSLAAGTYYYEIGNWFEFLNPCSITSASVVVDSATDIGATIYFTISDFNFNTLEYSEWYTIDSSDLGDTITLYFPSPIVIPTWDYYIINVCSDGIENLRVQMAQPAPVYSSFYVNDALNWFYLLNTPMVRANVDMFQSTDELSEEVSWSFYPNPADDMITISMLQNTTQNVIIRDLLGKTILNTTAEHGSVIDLGHLSSATYFISIGAKTKKIIIR